MKRVWIHQQPNSLFTWDLIAALLVALGFQSIEFNCGNRHQYLPESREQMRLLTHNMLSSNIKGVTNGFPLIVQVQKVEEKQVEINPEFLKSMFMKIEWKALVDASKSMGYADLPEQAHLSMLDSDDFLNKFHHALLELQLEDGSLICPETGRRFPVNKGIPNMLLHEDEV